MANKYIMPAKRSVEKRVYTCKEFGKEEIMRSIKIKR